MNLPNAQHFPVLRTRRLTLVAPESRHFEAFAVLHADPYTMRYIGLGMPLDRVDAWLHLAMLIGHWQMRGYGVWVAEDLDGRLAGRVGLFRPGNETSRRVAAKLGAKLGAMPAETIGFLGGPMQVFRYRPTP